jgi:hypothetical protein
MKTSKINFVATFIVLVLLSANVALAKHGGNRGNHSNNNNRSFNSSRNFNSSIISRISNSNHSNHSSIFRHNNHDKHGNHDNHDKHRKIAHVIGKVLRANHNFDGHDGFDGDSESCSSDDGDDSDDYSCPSDDGGDAPDYGDNDADDGDDDGDDEVTVEPARYSGQAYEPAHSNYVVLPGDSFYTISLKEYSTSKNSAFIAKYNSMPEDQGLTPGQVIQLPSISTDGELSESSSPIADELQAQQDSEVAIVNTKVNSKAPVVEAPRPKVTIGSTLVVDGQPFGQKQGAARLRVGGASLKIQILKWTAGSVKIRLPNLDLDSSVKGDIEVLKADGSLASRTPVEVSAASVVAAR